MGSESHPVWTLYDRLRTSTLNVKYYGCVLQHYQRWNTGIEIFLAIATSTSIGGLWIWAGSSGQWAWKVLAVPTAIVAACKPVLGLTKRIRDLESLVTGYRMLVFDLTELKNKVEQRREFDTGLQNQFNKTTQQERTLISRTPQARPNRTLLVRCREEVESELPIEGFYVPETE